MKVDHIIVGQGLAGSCLALQLIQRGKKIVVFDEPERNRASAVAAGLFNPVTGKRMTRSWQANEIFPYLIKFYGAAEKLLGDNFFYSCPIYRPFISVEEQNEWMAQSANAGLSNFVESVFTKSSFDHINDPFGGVLTKESGYLSVNSYTQAVSKLLITTGSYHNKTLEIARLKIHHNKIEYENIESSSIIFCDGLNSKKNAFFNWLPILPLKGETLTVSMDIQPGVIFNRGVYIVPNGQYNMFTIGATYQPGDITEGITDKSKYELEKKLTELVKIPFVIHHQNWGMRPTTPDRRPLLGAHPQHKNVIIFNGLGTKGVSLAPYFSGLLVNWLAGKSEIPNDVNIDRYKALYSWQSSD